MRTAEEFTRWWDDLRAKRGEAHREYLRNFHPEFDNLPIALIPWPYRPVEATDPVFCPRCSRRLIHYWWGGIGDSSTSYHEVACAGRLNWMMRRVPSALSLINHWQITLGVDDNRPEWPYDYETGEPMDGPR